MSEAKIMETEFPKPPKQSWYDNIFLPASWKLISGRLKSKKVLDIGCCTGWLSYHAKKEGVDILATDVFDTAVHPDLPFKKCDKENLPFDNSAFDFVLTANVLHHGNLKKTISEAYRVLKIGGELISLQEPCIFNDADEKKCLEIHCKKEIEMGLDERRPSLEKYRNAFSQFKKTTFYKMDDGMFAKPKILTLEIVLEDSHEGGIAIQAIK